MFFLFVLFGMIKNDFGESETANRLATELLSFLSGKYMMPLKRPYFVSDAF